MNKHKLEKNMYSKIVFICGGLNDSGLHSHIIYMNGLSWV